MTQVRPGTVLQTWTMDCFAGRVRSAQDLPSQVCDPRQLNPQTGPWFVEGARPGDTLAVHFVGIRPRETWGVSTTVPFFGSLTATPATAMLHPALPERTWIYAIDTGAGVVRYEARDTRSSPSSRSTPCTAPSAWRPRSARSARRWRPATGAATWTPRRCGPG